LSNGLIRSTAQPEAQAHAHTSMKVTLLYATAPRTVHESCVELVPHATVQQALQAAGWLQPFPELPQTACGVWGRKASLDTVLREGDRVEFYRALRVDPKVARRERYQGQGARSAGLFNRRRPGSKAGY
jgi:putative ubiquitin-RnfH superfamily antitoxin RatB of RatAB toxin-antitoxin module